MVTRRRPQRLPSPAPARRRDVCPPLPLCPYLAPPPRRPAGGGWEPDARPAPPPPRPRPRGADTGAVPRALRPPGDPGVADGPGRGRGWRVDARGPRTALDLGGRSQELGRSRRIRVGEPGSRFSHSVPGNHGNSHPSPNSVLQFVGLNFRVSPRAQWKASKTEVLGIPVAP